MQPLLLSQKIGNLVLGGIRDVFLGPKMLQLHSPWGYAIVQPMLFLYDHKKIRSAALDPEVVRTKPVGRGLQTKARRPTRLVAVVDSCRPTSQNTVRVLTCTLCFIHREYPRALDLICYSVDESSNSSNTGGPRSEGATPQLKTTVGPYRNV